ncbi:MAG: trypsin-like peptidase domain-containing protein [Phycisphaerae bacterium]|nr:trypsin-like peptidase domain-containing protein [Phycisphaerae bacterium]
MEKHGSLARQFFLLFLATVAAFLVVLKLDLAGRLAYSIEKARLKAIQESLPTPDQGARSAESTRRLTQAVAPAVVSITTERRVERGTSDDLHSLGDDIRRFLSPGKPSPDDSGETPDAPDDEPYRRHPEDEPFTFRTGLGSGFIVDADQGYVLTNRHVIEDGDVIRVQLADGRILEATLLGSDANTDLAVLKIDADRLFALPLGESEKMAVGDDVFAVGNAFGFGSSFSRGIISAMDRSNVPVRGIVYQKFIQTDAVINPGNSGGPLVNLSGEVIGVNTAIARPTGNFGGVGFAIPSDRVRELLPQLAAGRPIRRGFLGIRMAEVTDYRPEARKLGWNKPHGVIVVEVTDDSPAARGGLKENDILMEYDGTTVLERADVFEAVAATPSGTRVTVKIWRDGAVQALELQVGERPEEPAN